MSLEGALFALLIVSVPADWIVFAVLLRESLHRPYILALTLMTLSTGLIALGLTAYLLAVVNANFGYILPKETAQVTLRLTFVGFALFPFLFLWLYRSGRFRDGGPL
jgi:hypothetical protein